MWILVIVLLVPITNLDKVRFERFQTQDACAYAAAFLEHESHNISATCVKDIK